MAHSIEGAGPAAIGNGLAHLTARRTRASVAGVAWNLLTVGLSSVLALSVFLATSRVLSPADFGAVALAAAAVAIVSMIVPMAFGEALIQRRDLEPRHLDSVFWMTLGAGLAVYGALWLATPILAAWTGLGVLTAILPVLGLRILFDAAATVPASLVARRMQFRYTALRSLLANAVAAALCVWLVFEGYALWALVLSQIANGFVAMAVALVAARWRPGAAVSLGALRDLWSFGLYAMGGRILNQARLDQALMGLVLGASTLGLYYFAQRLFTMLRDLTAGAFGPVANVLMASLQAEPEKRRKAFGMASFASAALAFPMFSGLIVLAPQAVPIVFGPQWAEAIFPLQCLSVVGMMAGVGTVQAALIRNLGRPDWWFWYQTATKSGGLLAIVALAPFGLDAIAAGLAMVTLLLWPLSVRQTRRMLALSLSAYLEALTAPALASFVMAGAILWGRTRVTGLGEVAELAVLIIVGATVYGVTLVLVARRELADALTQIRQRREGAP